MTANPGHDYVEGPLDYEDPLLYAPSLGGDGVCRALPPTSCCSRVFSDLEDEKIWTRHWVAVGPAAQIPDAGDVLPYTVGNHGLHIERQRDGSLLARFNKAQHGGCRFIPTQCQSGRKTNCSYTSCGYSLDESPIRHAEIDDPGRRLGQYVGHNPDKLLPAAVTEIAGQLFVHVHQGAVMDLAPGEGALAGLLGEMGEVEPGAVHEQRWDANWKLVLTAWAGEGAEPCLPGSAAITAERLAVYPNLCVERHDGGVIVHVLQPVAMNATRVVSHCLGGRVRSVLEELRPACEIEQVRLEGLHASARARGGIKGFGYEHSREETRAGPQMLLRWIVDDLVRRYPQESTAVVYLHPSFSARRN